MPTLKDIVSKFRGKEIEKKAEAIVRAEIIPEKETIDKVSGVVQSIVSSPQATEQEKIAAKSLEKEIYNVIVEKTAAINKQDDKISIEFMKKLGAAFAEGMQEGMPQAPVDQANLGEMTMAAENAASQTGVVPAPMDPGMAPPMEGGMDPMAETIIEEVKDTAGKVVAEVANQMTEKAKAEGMEEGAMMAQSAPPPMAPPVDPAMMAGAPMAPPMDPAMAGAPAPGPETMPPEAKTASVRNDKTYKLASDALMGGNEMEIASNMAANEGMNDTMLSEDVEGADIEEIADELAQSIVAGQDKDEEGNPPAPLTAIGETPEDEEQEEIKEQIIEQMSGGGEAGEPMGDPMEDAALGGEAGISEEAPMPEEAMAPEGGEMMPEEGGLDEAAMGEMAPEEAPMLPGEEMDAAAMPEEAMAPEGSMEDAVLPEEGGMEDAAMPEEAPAEEESAEEQAAAAELAKKVTEDEAKKKKQK